jgi:hypothetical protein
MTSVTGAAVRIYVLIDVAGLKIEHAAAFSDHSLGAKDLEDLRNKIAAGDFRDDLVYYW